MVLSPSRLNQILGQEYATAYIAIFQDPKVDTLLRQVPVEIQKWELNEPEAKEAIKLSVVAIASVAISLAKIAEMFCDQIAEKDAIIAELRGAKMQISFGAPPKPSRWKRFLEYLNKL